VELRYRHGREDHWVFGDKRTKGKATGGHLVRFSWFPIQRHILVKGTSSPDDPALREYWAERERTKSRNLPVHLQKIARKQKSLCPLCGVSLFNDEEIQQHHKKPRGQGGTHEESNLVLVHLYCQQQIHSGKVEPKDAAGEPLLL